MNIKIIVSLMAFTLLPTATLSSSLTTFGFSGYQAYDGANIGFPVNLALEDRSEPLGTSGGLVNSRFARSFAGEISGGRTTRGDMSAVTQGLFAEDGFFLKSEVDTEVECLRNPTAGTCPPQLSSQATLEFSFTVDADATLFLDGFWIGGDGDLGINLVDYFSLSLIRLTANPFNPERLLQIDTNATGSSALGGFIDSSIGLLEGETYVLGYSLQTQVSSPGAVLVPFNDNGRFTLAASVIEANADVDAFAARFLAAAPVPLPAAGWMLLAGLGALVGLRRRATA